MSKNAYFNTDHLKQNLKTRAIKGTGATVFAQVSNYGIVTVGTIILARILTPDDFGLIAMVAAFSLLLQNFGINGFTEAIIQKEKINHKQVSTLFWINISISFMFMLLLMASAPLIASFYKEPRLISINIAMALSIFIGSISVHHLALLKRNMQFYHTSINDIVANILGVSIAIFMAYKGLGYWSLVSKHICYPLATTVGAWILCRWRPGLPVLNSGTKPMVKFALNIYGNFCLTYLRKNLDRVLIGRFLGSQPLGHYDRAHQLSGMLPNQLTIPLTGVAIATLSRLAHDSEKYNHYLSRIFSMLAFVALPVSAILALIGRDLIYFLLGPQWNQAGQIFSILGVSTGIFVIYNTNGWIHLSLGRADRWFRWNMVALLATLIFFLMGMPFGIMGVASAYTASFYILICPAIWYAGKSHKIMLSLFISAVWKYFISALIAGLLSWFFLHIFKYSSAYFLKLYILVRIFIVCGFYLSLYLILVIALFQSIKPILQFTKVFRDMILKSK